MNRAFLPPVIFLGLGAAATAAGFVLFQSGHPELSASPATDLATKSEVEGLRKEIEALRTQLASAPAAAAAPLREAKPAASPGLDAAASRAANVSAADRDAVFALIKEERDLREKERLEKAQKQMRDNLTRQVKTAAERVGIDANTTAELTRLYLANLDREADIRKAYPAVDRDDPNYEKRKLELDAARKDLQARVDALVPADKKEAWNRATRFVQRAGDFADMQQRMITGDFLPGTMGGGRGNQGGGGTAGAPAGGAPATDTAGGNPGGRFGRRNRQNGAGGAAPPAPTDGGTKKQN